MLGVIIGKFYPPHLGHTFLIQSGLDKCSNLVVIVCDHKDQLIRGETRAAWLSEQFPNVRVVVTPDDLPDEPQPWATRTIEILGKAPDVVFTSEDYGPGYAAAMGAEHVFVDLNRQTVPISATQIRGNPLENLSFLPACVRRDFVVRVVLIGVESTGKTTLAQDLAKELNTNWVPEFGREYSLQKVDDWATPDFVTIAKTQQEQENLAAETANKVLICDTNAFATSVWHRRYMGQYSPEVDAIARQDKVDLYLLTMPDFPFVQDGTRDGEHIRHEMHDWFTERLSALPTPTVPLQGSHPNRLTTALKSIQSVAENTNPFRPKP